MARKLYIKNGLDFKNIFLLLMQLTVIGNIEKAKDNKLFVCGIFNYLQKTP